MELELCGVRLHYEQYGGGNRRILMLHGWGCEIKHFAPIAQALEDEYFVTVIDFPAHGQSSPPPEPWDVAAFGRCVKSFMEQLGLSPCDIVAHSFGGRVALWLAANEPQLVNRLVLTGCAGIKKPATPAQAKRSRRYQRLKRAYTTLMRINALRPMAEEALTRLRNRYGSADYNALSEDMRKTFVRIVSEDLSPLLPRIQAPTLLVWGENDADTPLWMGREMERTIPDAGLVLFEGDDHYAYLRQWPRFVRIVRAFLK